MRNRLWNIVSIGIMVAILGGGWFLGVDPQLSAARASNEQSAAVDAQNDATRATAEQLILAEKDLPGLQNELATLQRSVPATAQTSAFIDDLNVLATTAGVTVSAITVSDAQPYVAPVAADVPAAATAETPAGGETGDAAPATVDPLAPPAATSPLVTSENFVLVPISVEAKGSAQAVLDFVSGLQNGKRLFLVTSYSSSLATEDKEAGIVTATTTGYIYALLGQYTQ